MTLFLDWSDNPDDLFLPGDQVQVSNSFVPPDNPTLWSGKHNRGTTSSDRVEFTFDCNEPIHSGRCKSLNASKNFAHFNVRMQQGQMKVKLLQLSAVFTLK